MEALLILLGLVVIVAPIGVVLLWIGHNRLRARVALLETQLAALATAPAATLPTTILPAAPLPTGAPATVETAPPPIPPIAAEPAPAASPWDRALREAPTPAEAPPPIPDQNQPLVLRGDRIVALLGWLRDNWVYVVSALSLALAGVFFVQYGVERGLLPPPARVALAILFGAALIAFGEWVRHRWGDDPDKATAYLPSVFSGAGTVAIFAGIVAGRLMYALYGPGLTFAGLLATAAGAVLLGWRHGPFLVAIGLVGAGLTPFLVGGDSSAPDWLHGYYLLVAAAGLAVDAIRRWAWVSVLALLLGFAGPALMVPLGASEAGWLLTLAALPLLAILLPPLRLIPEQEGPCTLLALWQRSGIWPAFPVRLAGGTMLAGVVGLALAPVATDEAMLGFALLAGLGLALLIWASKAEGLADLALLPALGFLAKLALAEDLVWQFRDAAILLRPPETAPPLTVTILLGLATLLTGAAALRSLKGGAFALPLALGAILVAPLAVLELELIWQPALVLGLYPWALHVLALAALMVGLALAFARADGAPGRRSAWATLSALSLIALALFLLTSAAALTLALAVLVLVAAGLDRRFNLPEMGWFLQAGMAVLSYRLIADPGLDWALQAPLAPVVLAYGGSTLAAFAARRLLPPGRVVANGVAESAGFAFAALTANALLSRLLIPENTSTDPDWSLSHWGIVLNALPWLILMLTQLHRASLGGVLRRFRLVLAGFAGLLAAGAFALAVGPMNPLFAWGPESTTDLVQGPVLLNSLALAYGLPGLVLIAAAWKLALPRLLARLFLGLGTALVVLYAALAIRHIWWGPWLGAPDVLQGELYSYTLALLVTGAALLWQALARRSHGLQRIAMAVIALTVAKVFLWDASGLTGLTRVLSFAGLGLSLAALAWLNRWAKGAVSEQRGGGT